MPGVGGGTCRAVEQQLGHLFYNRGQEATTEPVLRSPLPTPLLATRQGPGNKVSTSGSRQMESDLHLRVWNHTQESSPLSLLLVSLLPPPPPVPDLPGERRESNGEGSPAPSQGYRGCPVPRGVMSGTPGLDLAEANSAPHSPL